MSTARRQALAHLFLLLGGVMAGLGLCEIALRVHYVVDRPARISDLRDRRALPPRRARLSLGDVIQPAPNARRIFELRPSLRVIFPNVWMQTNAQGWRDAPFTVDKPSDTIRILGLGDSVMFGWAVDVEARYTDRLEDLLDARHPTVDWQVYTMACPGYNLAMLVETLEEQGLAYAPDLLLYGYVANDACLPNFVGAEMDVWGSRSFLRAFLRDLELPAPTLVNRRDTLDGPVAEFSVRHCLPESVAPRYRHLVGDEVFDAAFERLQAIAARLDVPLVVVSHPLIDGLPLSTFPDNVPVVYATAEPGEPGYRTLLPEQRVGPRDPHPSAETHALIAERIVRGLDQHGILDGLLSRVGSTSR